jgi:hypothetical protein
MVFAQIIAVAEDTTVSAVIGGRRRMNIPTILHGAQPPVPQELWAFLLDGKSIIGLGPTYNWPP